MTKKSNMFSLLLSIISGEEKPQSPEKIIESRLGAGYEEYLEKPKEHHDTVIKRMYRNTRYADETPDRLREILREQVAGQDCIRH
jgi:hypothetical protein